MEISNTHIIIVIGIILIVITHLNTKEKFTMEHLSGPSAGATDALYNKAMTTTGGKAVNAIIDDVATKLTQDNKLPNMNMVKADSSLNNLFADDLKGVTSPVNVGGFVPNKLNTVSTPDTAGLLTPELAAIAKANDKNQKLVSKDLLPKDKKDNWFADIPATVTLDDANMNAYYITLPMIGSSRKNSSYDIRSGMPVAKFSVSPWMNSSLDTVIQNGSMC